MIPAAGGALVQAAIDDVLESIATLAGADAAAHFRDAVQFAELHGEAVAGQHLRNKLLAYLDPQAYPHQPRVGFTPRMRGEVTALVEALEDALLAHFTPPPREPRAAGGTRVLLLIDHLPPRDRIFSHARQVCTYAAALALDASVEAILVLATRESAPENPFIAFAEMGSGHEASWRAELEGLAGGPVPKVRFQTPGRAGPVRPYEESVAFALEFDPDVVFCHLGVFGSRLLPRLLGPRAAMIGVQMNQNNPEPPYADLVLAHGYSADFSAKPTPAKWRNHEVPIVPFPKQSAIDAGDLGPDSPLRIVTVLTLGRLEKGLMRNDAAGLRFIVAFLQEHAQAVWLLVAVEDPEAFADAIEPRVPPDVAGRIRLLPVVPDLGAIYEHCHIYMHPPPLGGGNMGIAMAIAEGIPVLAAAGTDGANSLIPGQTYRDPRQAARMLRRLADEPELRLQRAAQQRRKIERRHSIPAASVAFHSFLTDALAAFEGRRAAHT